MSKIFNLPRYRKVIYDYNPETGYYNKSKSQADPSPFYRLPFELLYTVTRADKIKCNAKHIIHSKTKTPTGSYQFVTGLQPVGINGYYVGNDYEIVKGLKVLSYILFHFSDDNSRLTVYYFSKWDKLTSSLRIKYAQLMIPRLS